MKKRKQSNNYCLLIRGKPCSGKSTVVNSLSSVETGFTSLDPDDVNIKSQNYAQFTPRQTRNPTENVKMYCYLYNNAEKNLSAGRNVVWSQPWSRMAEIELTVRNFGFYLTDLKEKVWKSNIENIIKKLPFNFLVAEISIDNATSTRRWNIKRKTTSKKLERLKKTQKLFQPFVFSVPYIKLNGTENSIENAEKIVRFLKNRN